VVPKVAHGTERVNPVKDELPICLTSANLCITGTASPQRVEFCGGMVIPLSSFMQHILINSFNSLAEHSKYIIVMTLLHLCSYQHSIEQLATSYTLGACVNNAHPARHVKFCTLTRTYISTEHNQ
jgi:hypothetical protein